MKHTVKQGEHVVRLAYEHGFRDWTKVWQNGANADLRSLRENPNVLLPGDELFLPDFLEKGEFCGTGQVHPFTAPALNLQLKIVVRDVNGDPIPSCECLLAFDGNDRTLVTDGEGKLNEEIPPGTTSGEIRIRGSVYRLSIGHLDPVEEKTGQRARLANLGYYFEEDEDLDDEKFRSAVEEFQCDHDLDVDGKCGPNTQKKLKKVHGC